MGIAILLTATFAVHSPLIHAQSPAVQKAVRLLGERNEAAIAKIRTLMCSYRMELLVQPKLDAGFYGESSYSGQYLRKGNDFYSTRNTPEGLRCFWQVELKKGDRLYGFQVTDNPIEKPIRSYGNAVDPNQHIGTTTLWDHFLIRHNGPQGHFLPDTFNGLLAQPHLILNWRIDVQDKNSLEYVKLRHANGTLEFWFDPEWSSWVRKSTFHVPEYSHTPLKWEVKEISRSQDGAIIPTVIDRLYYDRGQLVNHARTTLSDVHLNSQFHFTGLKGPTLEGSLCDDQTRGTRYLIDGIGNPIGPETIIPPRIPPEKRLYPFDINVEIPPNNGSKDTLSKTDWVIFAAAVLTCLISITWLVRNRYRH
jgi:hypothetical protein